MGSLGSSLITARFGSTAGRVVQSVAIQGAALIAQVYYSTQSPNTINPGTSGPWRPPQWSRPTLATPPLTLLPNTGTAIYVFDGALRAEHDQQSVITLNPVQTGAAITDHAYILPARLVIEILMSDAMQSYGVSQWADGPSKSVSAYQALVALQKARTVFSVGTRLRQYDQMLIADIRAEDTKETTYGLKAVVTFVQLISAQVQTTAAASTNQQTTAQSSLGNVSATPIPPNIAAQNSVTSESEVPAAGGYTSVVGQNTVLSIINP